MTAHGLLPDSPPPSREVLLVWTDRKGITRDEDLVIAEMGDGGGWRMMSERDMEIGELICAIPKTSLLSHRTSSLPALPSLSPTETQGRSMNSHTILHLSLCLLHEFRLGTQSDFYGYLQSLPRTTIGLPIFWDIDDVSGKDGKLARDWLKYTEVEKELKIREEQGLGLSDLNEFYKSYSSHLPSTESHPNPSPVEAFYYCFSLVSTRAFMVDLYHLIALCPFADILNHSSTSNSHTSLSSDDFVCHSCGSLKSCSHDILNPTNGIPYRLSHIGIKDYHRIENEIDTVDLRIENPLNVNNQNGSDQGGYEEVFNCYGEGLSDSRLLTEWGFISEEFIGEGLTWNVDELDPDENLISSHVNENEQGLELLWEIIDSAMSVLVERSQGNWCWYSEESLLCPQNERDKRLFNLDQSARISINIFAFMWLSQRINLASKVGNQKISQASEEKDELIDELVKSIEELSRLWDNINSQNDPSSCDLRLEDESMTVAKKVKMLLQSRLEGMHKSELSQEELFDTRDSLGPEEKYQYMAMTISINERSLLRSAIGKWDELLSLCRL
ncbi:uncharacterized protein IL334_004161 [Kwoniella shivajii]|uniref:SET domain-containing protein n=1 Tax=Kwoniella shivajii TaxID=564305 RepID=A0ABZ1CZJ7_9TREE|nr:hypothetical protein IL334_004161 [Kwoniella shivajii]